MLEEVFDKYVGVSELDIILFKLVVINFKVFLTNSKKLCLYYSVGCYKTEILQDTSSWNGITNP